MVSGLGANLSRDQHYAQPSLPSRIILDKTCICCNCVFKSNIITMIICEFCSEELSSKLIYKRRIILTNTLPMNLYSISSFFKYDLTIRTLIHNIKIKNNYYALKLICSLVLEGLCADSYFKRFKFISAAPSSLWGRLFGKFDLANLFANECAIKFGLKFINLPSCLFWSLKKQALITGREKNQVLFTPSFSLIHQKDLLIVDDVVTTGHTAILVCSRLTTQSIHWFAIADARR